MYKISVDKLKYKLDNPDSREELHAYCPDCKNWVWFDECDAPCPYWDPYCTHPGVRCETCFSKFDFMEGYKEIIRFNETMNKQEEDW